MIGPWGSGMQRAGLFAFLLAVNSMQAHPAIGIVADAGGVIYYSDNQQVWRVAPGGQRTLAVARVHAHELWLDAAGNLYGEHLWYEGERTNRWGHRVWKRLPNGEVTDVIPARAGFREDYRDFSFVRSPHGWMYWLVRQGRSTQLQRNLAGGRNETLEDLGDIRPGWLGVTPSGGVLFAVRGVIWRRPPSGKAQPIHEGSLGTVMGIWADREGNVYAALPERRAVARIGRRGAVSVADRSPSPWRPSGGVVGPDGRLWVLEFNPANEQRARPAGRDAAAGGAPRPPLGPRPHGLRDWRSSPP